MNGTDSARSRVIDPRWKPWFGWITAGAAILAAALVIRSVGGPSIATAQAPARPAATPKASAGTTKAAPPVAPAAGKAPAGAPTGPATGKDPGEKVALPAVKELKVMAVVNTEQITRQELGKECLRRYGKEVLEAMVNKQLITGACAKQNIKITDADVIEEMDRISAKFGLTRDRWLQMLRDERGLTEEDYRREVFSMLALRRLALDKLTVSQEELQHAIEADYGPKVKVRLIVAHSQAKADDLQKKAAADPEKFAEIAMKGDDPSVASARGIIPPIRKHVGDPELEKVAFALKPGQVSKVVKAGGQYFIIKCEQQIQGTTLDKANLDQVKKVLTERIKEQRTRDAATDLFVKLQKEAKVENVYNDPKKQAQNPGIAAIINGQPISVLQLSEECLTRHGREILDGEINRKILTQALTQKKQAVSEKDIDAEVARTAEMYGYMKEGKPDVEGWLKHLEKDEGATVELYVSDAVWPAVALRKLVGTKVDVNDADIQKSFESHYGPKVEVQAIVLNDQRQAQKVWEQARNQPTEEYFAKLAEHHSIEPVSKANGGKVPPIRKHGGQGAIEEEAFRLQPGGLSGVVAMGDRYIIMRCLGRTKPQEMNLADVREDLILNLREQKLRVMMTTEMDRLKDSAQIDNFLAGTSKAGRTASAGAAKAAPSTAGKYDVVPATATKPTMKK